MLTAITRGVSASLATGELTFRDRVPIDIPLARRQHEEYERTLAELGVLIDHLPAEDALADAVFVEDVGMMLDEIGIVTAPGAASRRAETESIAHAMSRYRPVHRLTAPATLDGGDVVQVDRTMYVGLSSRTNSAGIDQLGALVSPLGYMVRAVPVRGALHLKTACTYAGRGVLLANPEWAATSAFGDIELLTEQYASCERGKHRLEAEHHCGVGRGHVTLRDDLQGIRDTDGAYHHVEQRRPSL